MALRNVQIKKFDSSGEHSVRYWEGLQNNDEGSPLKTYGWTEFTIQVSGIFHRAVVHIQGSLDGETWSTFLNKDGEPIEISDHSIYTFNQRSCFVRPIFTGGDSLSGVDVYILGSK